MDEDFPIDIHYNKLLGECLPVVTWEETVLSPASRLADQQEAL